jgi:N-acetylmuramoyl-L-alanine amidase
VPQSLRSAVIVVDPGHNGANGSHPAEINRSVDAGGFGKACNTTGTAEGGYAEAEFNWELAQAVRARLSQLGARVILTRPDNHGWGPCIDQRGLIASSNHATLLLSLHADGAAPGAHGFHVIHPSPIAGYTTATSGPSAALATDVRDALVAGGFQPATYVGGQGLIQRGDLGTLNRAGVPAVMVECGNMHNAADLAVLRSSGGQARLADALVRGLATWAG